MCPTGIALRKTVARKIDKKDIYIDMNNYILVPMSKALKNSIDLLMLAI
jgi:hypothetical protein